ncbi:MAG TPA: Holliday junction branch migration protein RuvA [Gammaproteobacteria bacterium]|nr:Holliday junction branch migration protein RuvA [Gammaproteobacteria bacterium]
MIGQLKGILLEKQAPSLLIDVQGVGYEVAAPMSTFYVLPEIDQPVTLHTHLVVREDSHTLYGFASIGERSLFRNLIKVNGVGAKLALTILSGVSANDFVSCIEHEDSAALVRLPGVGKKTAERLIIEMKDRLKDLSGQSLTQTFSRTDGPAQADHAVGDAVSALVALGYKAAEASRMVRSVNNFSSLGSEELIRQALQATVK